MPTPPYVNVTFTTSIAYLRVILSSLNADIRELLFRIIMVPLSQIHSV